MNRVRARLLDERGGAITLHMMILGPLLVFGLFGFVYDAGQAINLKARTDDVAQSAARAALGAVALGPDGPALDTGEAVALGEALIAKFPEISGTVTVTGDGSVLVRTESAYVGEVLPGFDFTFTSEKTAEAQIGVLEDDDV